MELDQDDLDRLKFFELAETTYTKDPLDAEAIAKLEEALTINPKKHDALWYLGSAYTTIAFLTSDQDEATASFDKATQCFKQAVYEDPGNEMYLESLEMSSKAPEFHMMIHKSDAFDQQTTASEPSTSSTVKSTKKKSSKKISALKYGIFGWVILAVGLVAWVGFTKSHAPLPPAR